MKTNLSKTKLTRLCISTLMIATILQLTAISMVQATTESIDRPTTPPVPTDTVVTTNEDPNLFYAEDQRVVMPENGELISPLPENFTRTEDQETDFVKPADNATIGITEVGNEENYQPLIAPNPQTENETRIMGAALLLVAVGTIAAVFIAIGYKKTK